MTVFYLKFMDTQLVARAERPYLPGETVPPTRHSLLPRWPPSRAVK